MPLRIGFFGAGAIGSYLGLRLSAAGYPVILVGRKALVDARPDLVALDLDGREYRPQQSLVVSDTPASLASVDVCLVTTKSADTPAAGALLRDHLSAHTVVISLQNGLHNADTLTEIFGRTVVPGMITYNVRRESPTRFRKATSGPIMIGSSAGAELAQAFAQAGEPVALRGDMPAVQLTKLLLNLNNGLCALTGLSIAESIRSRDLRRAFAACLSEGIGIAQAGAMPLTRLGPLSPPLVARLLTIPDFLFFRLAGTMMAIDPAARSSTLQDLDRGKPTEIDFLNGEIAALAHRIGREAPANAWVTEQIHALERVGAPYPFLTPAQVWQSVARLRLTQR